MIAWREVEPGQWHGYQMGKREIRHFSDCGIDPTHERVGLWRRKQHDSHMLACVWEEMEKAAV